MKTCIIPFFALTLFIFCAFPILAQDATPVSASGSLIVEKISGATHAVSEAADKVPPVLNAVIMAVLGFLLDLAIRAYPTFKPKSLLLAGALIFKSVADFFLALSRLIAKLSALMDNVVQNIKDPEQK